VVCRICDGIERESPPANTAMGSGWGQLIHGAGLEDLHPHAQSYGLCDRAVVQHVSWSPARD
jgi:hypothetical protein